jgi:elongation factor Ts
MTMTVDISASMVKELREKSGAAMMDCKKALVEAQGDSEKAFEILRQRGIAVASKKATRSASEGLIVGKLSADDKEAVLLEVNCETDFVARNPEFVELTKEIAETALKHKSATVEQLLEAKTASGSVKDLVTEKISKTGENIVPRRVEVVKANSPDGTIGMYIHALGGKMGAIVEFASSKKVGGEEMKALAREIAMHIVSAKPQFISRTEISAEVIENERRIESGKADLADKKPEMRDKIVQGRLDKILAERCLLDQPFVKDPSLTIAAYLKQKSTELGAEIKPVSFKLMILGEALPGANGNEAE